MKKVIFKSKYIISVVLFLFILSCNEKNFLEEIPSDFYSAENSYSTFSDYQRALNYLYANVRKIHYGGDGTQYYTNFIGTDLVMSARCISGGTTQRFGDYDIWLVPTETSVVRFHWESWYRVVSSANAIISRLKESELTDEQKQAVAAEAKFFRAFAYRYLVYLYGGVPLILEEVTSPKTDYVRATKEAVLKQMVIDFSEAANSLPSINEVADGKVSNIVASHYLAETYIALGKYNEAIIAATVVINDPNVGLMTNRFGSRVSENENVFWDLFQRHNQNRGRGNKEALWVIQMETDVTGGLLVSIERKGNLLERWAGPVNYLSLTDPDGVQGMLGLAISGYNTCGRGQSYMMNTDFFLNTLWESDFDNDIRNSPHNIVRDAVYVNPNSAYYGKSVVEFRSPLDIAQEWRWYPWPSKVTTPGDHPDAVYQDKETQLLSSAGGATYTDQYMLRLAETYLLRAEAYMDNGDKTKAAADINVVRSRSKANPVSASEVTLDYILDERGRELVYEEQRRITLSRTGKLVERVRKYNPLNSDEIKDFHNLFPIPYSEIESNKDAVIEQNPGY